MALIDRVRFGSPPDDLLVWKFPNANPKLSSQPIVDRSTMRALANRLIAMVLCCVSPAVILVASVSSAETSQSTYVVAQDNALLFYSSDGKPTSSEHLTKGTYIRVEKVDGDVVFTTYNGKPAYIRLAFLAKPEPVLVVAEDDAQLFYHRDGHPTGLENLAKGTRINFEDASGDRVFTTYNGKPAYIRSNFLTTEKMFFESEQRAKGLVKYKGDWVAPAEKFRREQMDKGLVEYRDQWVTPETKANLEKGLVQYDGNWITPEERFRREQTAKGLVEYRGQWVTPDVKANLEKGLIEYNGAWVTPQQKEKLETERLEAGRRAAAERNLAQLWLQIREVETRIKAIEDQQRSLYDPSNPPTRTYRTTGPGGDVVTHSVSGFSVLTPQARATWEALDRELEAKQGELETLKQKYIEVIQQRCSELTLEELETWIEDVKEKLDAVALAEARSYNSFVLAPTTPGQGQPDTKLMYARECRRWAAQKIEIEELLSKLEGERQKLAEVRRQNLTPAGRKAEIARLKEKLAAVETQMATVWSKAHTPYREEWDGVIRWSNHSEDHDALIGKWTRLDAEKTRLEYELASLGDEAFKEIVRDRERRKNPENVSDDFIADLTQRGIVKDSKRIHSVGWFDGIFVTYWLDYITQSGLRREGDYVVRLRKTETGEWYVFDYYPAASPPLK